MGLIVGLLPGHAAATDELQCPATLETTQTATHPVDAWSSAQQGKSSRLLYIEVYAGPWQQEQPVPPDETRDTPVQQSLIWRLRGNPSAEGTWLVCNYQNTQVKLARRLPDSVSECLQVNSRDPKRVVKLLEQRCR